MQNDKLSPFTLSWSLKLTFITNRQTRIRLFFVSIVTGLIYTMLDIRYICIINSYNNKHYVHKSHCYTIIITNIPCSWKLLRDKMRFSKFSQILTLFMSVNVYPLFHGLKHSCLIHENNESFVSWKFSAIQYYMYNNNTEKQKAFFDTTLNSIFWHNT